MFSNACCQTVNNVDDDFIGDEDDHDDDINDFVNCDDYFNDNDIFYYSDENEVVFNKTAKTNDINESCIVSSICNGLMLYLLRAFNFFTPDL